MQNKRKLWIKLGCKLSRRHEYFETDSEVLNGEDEGGLKKWDQQEKETRKFIEGTSTLPTRRESGVPELKHVLIGSQDLKGAKKKCFDEELNSR